MGKKNRGSRGKGKRRASATPDDVLALSFARMERWGRFISMRTEASAEEHAAATGAFIGGADDVRRDLEQRRARLVDILHEADVVDLLARASLVYLRIDPDTFKDWEDDRSPAHIEYLGLQAVGTGSFERRDVDPARAWELTFEAVEIVRAMFHSARLLLVMDAVAERRDAPDDPVVGYRLSTRLESLGVRGAGYTEHLVRVIHGCLDPFDRECREHQGFTATDALTLAQGMVDLVADRVEPRAAEAASAYTDAIRRLKRERRGRERESRRFPDWLLSIGWPQAQRHVAAVTTAWLFADSRSLALITPEELSATCTVELEACRAFLEAFTCPPELFQLRHHGYPCGAHPLTTHPIIRTGDGYLLPVASSMIDAIRPRMEDLLHQDQTMWDRYVHARGRYVEAETTASLAGALPGARSWTGIPWRAPEDNSDLDGLVTTDALTIRLQCKAGRLTAPARRGAAERMKREIEDLIQAADEQHQALDRALRSQGARRIGFSYEQADALDTALQFEAIVCLDDVTVWATETHELRRLGTFPDDRHVPWVLSLTDLMAVVDLLQGSELAHYLIRRQRLERDGRIKAHDELDWVGHYIAEGLFFDRFFEPEDPPTEFRLLSYTEPIDAWYFTRSGLRTTPAPKPSQPIPERLHVLIQRLERERPTNWILACIALLDGDEATRNSWDKTIAHVNKRTREEGWSNATQIYNERLGMTLYIDRRIPWPIIRRHLTDYCTTKIDQHHQPNWIGIGQGATGGIFVIAIEKGSPSIADTFLNPPRPRSQHTDPAPDAHVTRP